jgi:Flp pilus assembly protein TadB
MGSGTDVALLFGVAGGLLGLGVLIAATAWSPPPAARVVSRRDWSRLARPLAAGALAGVLALAFTGWIAAGLGGAWGGYAAVRALCTRRMSSKVEQERITALASWCEQLRDLLTAEHGIIGTIAATARTCPEPIRPEVERLATRLSRQHPSTAIRQFAAELDDPSGDLVASVLLLATTRSSRTSELLSELAGTIRDRAAMRLRVEADRAGQRSEARFILAFSAAAVLGVLVFGRDSEFLDAYDSVEGQLVFAIVVAMFVLGGIWMARLTRFERPARFLSISEER